MINHLLFSILIPDACIERENCTRICAVATANRESRGTPLYCLPSLAAHGVAAQRNAKRWSRTSTLASPSLYRAHWLLGPALSLRKRFRFLGLWNEEADCDDPCRDSRRRGRTTTSMFELRRTCRTSKIRYGGRGCRPVR